MKLLLLIISSFIWIGGSFAHTSHSNLAEIVSIAPHHNSDAFHICDQGTETGVDNRCCDDISRQVANEARHSREVQMRRQLIAGNSAAFIQIRKTSTPQISIVQPSFKKWVPAVAPIPVYLLNCVFLI